MTDLVPLTTRQLPAPNGTVMPAPALPPMSLPDKLQMANAMATAGDLIPQCYRGKPGAVLLAWLWAEPRGIDPFTAMQNIYPIQGRPFVSAEMRTDMAAAKGYDFDPIRSDDQACVLRVTYPDGRTKVVAVTMPGVERPDCDLHLVPPAEDVGKANWKSRTSDMLYAAACRLADRRLVRSGAGLLDAAQDYDNIQPDPLEVLAPPKNGAEVLDRMQSAAGADLGPEPPASSAPVGITIDDLMRAAWAAGRIPPRARTEAARAALVTLARDLVGVTVAKADELVADQDQAEELLAKLTPAAQ